MKNAGYEVINKEGIVEIKATGEGRFAVEMLNRRCRDVDGFQIHGELWVVDRKHCRKILDIML